MGGLNFFFHLHTLNMIHGNQIILCSLLYLKLRRIRNFRQAYRSAKISNSKTAIMIHLAVVVFNLVEILFRWVICWMPCLSTDRYQHLWTISTYISPRWITFHQDSTVYKQRQHREAFIRLEHFRLWPERLSASLIFPLWYPKFQDTETCHLKRLYREK